MDDNNQNVLSILVATDLHVGYKEKDPERGKDSFIALEEIFTIAKQKNVDFILLGGDLFHENKPSRKTLHWTMELFRKYCFGDRPCHVEVVSDQVVNFGHTSSSITSVNYENPHMNISMPVFSIHGNHDDPTGTGELSAIDFLSVAGLLNHFGKQTRLDEIEIQPVLLQKGTTNVALYGLGSIRDERLHHLFLKKSVTFFRPQEKFGEWFNIFVLHQNRAKHGATNYIPEEFIDEFINLVVWGHEHECRIDLELNVIKKFFVMQPGSPVATSLCAGESKPKHVAVVKIRGCEMKTEKIPLQTSRQMFVEDVVLADCVPLKGNESVEQMDLAVRTYCRERVRHLISRAEDEHSGHPKQPTKPLIRLRVDYTGDFDTFNAYRFGAEFADQVANQESIVRFLKKSVKRQTAGINVDGIDAMISDIGEKVKIADLVQEFLDKMDKKDQMTLLTARGLSRSVNEFVDKHENSAISDLCEHQIKKTKDHLLTKKGEMVLERGEIVNEVNRFHEERESQERHSDGDYSNEAGRSGRPSRDVELLNSDSDGKVTESTEVKPTNTRGRKSSAKPRGRGRGSKSASSGRKAGLVDSFFSRSQVSSTKSPIRRATSYDNASDDDVIVMEAESSPRFNPSKRSSSVRSVRRKERGQGVVYMEPDEEDDNPFAAAANKRKKR